MNINLDPMQSFALQLFCLESSTFQEVPCGDDPRGYVDVIGNDLDTQTTLKTGTVVSSVALFYDHISFILPRADIGILIMPHGDGERMDMAFFSSQTQSFLGSRVIKRESFLDEIKNVENGGLV